MIANLPERIVLDGEALGVHSRRWSTKELEQFGEAVRVIENGRVNFSVDESKLPRRHPAMNGNYGLGDMVGAFVSRREEYARKTRNVSVGTY